MKDELKRTMGTTTTGVLDIIQMKTGLNLVKHIPSVAGGVMLIVSLTMYIASKPSQADVEKVATQSERRCEQRISELKSSFRDEKDRIAKRLERLEHHLFRFQK